MIAILVLAGGELMQKARLQFSRALGAQLSAWLSQSTCELPDVTPAGKVHL